MEPFKEKINARLVNHMAECLWHNQVPFERERFLALALDGLELKELKARCQQVAGALQQSLNEPFPIVAGKLSSCLKAIPGENATSKNQEDGLEGWSIWILQEYVAENGLDHPEHALPLLREMTRRFTSEFGIRPFIENHPLITLKTFQVWAKDPCEHVRRLVSEGSRPLLPWGKRLKRLAADPSPVIPLLETLKDDPSPYVRRSVANHLNDLSKINPDLACTLAGRWAQHASPQRRTIVRQGLRTLIKKGHPKALALIGCNQDPEVNIEWTSPCQKRIPTAGNLSLQVRLDSSSVETQTLEVDYVIHHLKANGSHSPKVFKWKNLSLPAQASVYLNKNHSFRPVTTRRYYPGTHRFELRINGKTYHGFDFQLD
jgi:3-methyladenine DNA glycosylase AlkC